MKFRIIYFTNIKDGENYARGLSFFEFSFDDSAPRSLLGFEDDNESTWLLLFFLNFKIRNKINSI